MNGPERRAVLTGDFVSAGDTASQSEHRKKSSKDFKIDFDDDIDFDVHFRKTKVCARFNKGPSSQSFGFSSSHVWM